MPAGSAPTLSDEEVGRFIADGFVRIDEAFPRRLAEEGRAILWRETGCDPDDPSTWIRPVIRLGGYGQEPFRQVVNTPRLRAAFDRLVGVGRWRPRRDLGSFPIRFPSADDPGDTGWHIDISFPSDDPGDDPADYFTWRANVFSRGRALLMLFLFSDVGETDAPTRIRVSSHLDVARLLEPQGEAGMSLVEVSRSLGVTAGRVQALATGGAGTVYLCHPFLAHAAQPHRGSRPRFMAQPGLDPASPIRLFRQDNDYSPVEIAIRRALQVA